ncbi:DUF305 domain-containing protein [Novosphingobium pentaromativorans]|uniref:DUF305 domain-containing protein n=1 Tax=Novosphingobium pentaromativorans TaxID=205844 RepID=UPI00051F6354|nr:DUF305 domain-containing protein [Novosphingobium pentaromativorans]AIT79183.1 hypothetical protein JI59_04935 [Novosphingobium pentaromativorans US6-1]
MKIQMRLRQVVAISLSVLVTACNQAEPQQSGKAAKSVPSEAISFDLGPFFYAETAMYDNMRSAIGTSSGDNWVRMMIAHHEGGAEISRIALQQNPPLRIADLARRTVKAQERAAVQLEKLLRDGPVNMESAFIFVSPIQSMHDASMAIDGSDVSEIWLRKMIEHHRGAIEMSNVLLSQPRIPKKTVTAVEELNNAQHADMKVLEQALDDQKSQEHRGSP